MLAIAIGLGLGCGRVGLELKPHVDPGVDAGPGEHPDEPFAEDHDTLQGDAEVADTGDVCDDRDGDERCAARDNCPEQPNPDQVDQDGDGLGDACDEDRDGDGTSNERDRCPRSAPDDADGDLVCDDNDVCLRGDDHADADADGTPDACDACPKSTDGDSDGDGRCDDVDTCPGSNDGVDADADGVADGCDACPLEPSKAAPDVCDCAREPFALARWRFDEGSGAAAADSVGSQAGTLYNMSATSWQPGRSGNALRFDGIDDHVSVGALAAPVRSVAFWLRAESLGVSSAETPWFSPGANGGVDRQWLDPANTYESDDRYSNAGLGLIDFNAHDWHGFHLVVPSGAVVPGIVAEVEFDNSNPTCTFGIELSWGAGAANTYTATRFESPPFVLNEYLSFGGANQSWGHTWSVAQLGDALFRLRLTKGGIPGSPMTPGVDHIRVKAFYALSSAAPRHVLVLAGGVHVQVTPEGVAVPGWPAGTRLFVDGSTSAVLDTLWHHVVVSSPTSVTVSDLQIGGALREPGFFQGDLDDVRMFAETLSPDQARALSARVECGR